jgi:hypothetical protein
MLFRWSQNKRPGHYEEIFSAATTLELVEQGGEAVERLGMLHKYALRLSIPKLTAHPLSGRDEIRCAWVDVTVPRSKGTGTVCPDWGKDVLTIRSQLAERASDLFAAACVALRNPTQTQKR